jgi:hypothetical protein
MATTNNAAVRPPEAIKLLQLFMNDSLAALAQKLQMLFLVFKIRTAS